MSYSRRELYAMGEPLGESITRKEAGRIIYGSGGGGSSTTNTSNIPDWLRPQVESLLGGATQQIFNTTPKEDGSFQITGMKPYNPYSASYGGTYGDIVNAQSAIAGFDPLQTQAYNNARSLQTPGQFAAATDLAGQSAAGGRTTADQGTYYGNQGFLYGQQGRDIGLGQGVYYGNQGATAGQAGQQIGANAAALSPAAQQYGTNAANIGNAGSTAAQATGRDVGSQAINYAGQAANAGTNYANQTTDSNLFQRYMNPYQQNVIDVQNAAAQRQADIASTQRGAQATAAGAFGGSRQAIENAEAQKNLASLQNANQVTGLNTAYNNAIQNMQYGANLNLQGLQGAQQGLGTALQGGQLGLSGVNAALQGQQTGLSGLNTANQLYGTGIQGANTGIQGAGMGLQGTNAQLAGTAQGMQGSGLGLQGVNAAQAGYGMQNTAANTLGNLGGQQLAAQSGILGLQNQMGGQQQQYQQSVINQAINNYAQQQGFPMQQFNSYNALLRGYAIPGQTTSQYQAQPALASQIAGLGTTGIAGLGLYNATQGR